RVRGRGVQVRRILRAVGRGKRCLERSGHRHSLADRRAGALRQGPAGANAGRVCQAPGVPSPAMKGVILAGGTGSRLHPLTRITNKHLLPIFDRPMVTYAIEALVGAGVTEMMVVTGGTHAGEFLRLLGNGHEWGIDRLLYAYQEKPGGIAEALGLAQRFVEDDQVIVVLGNNIFEYTIRAAVERFRQQKRGGRILLAEISDPEHLRHLGVPAFDGDRRIVKVVEKPPTPPSTFAV